MGITTYLRLCYTSTNATMLYYVYIPYHRVNSSISLPCLAVTFRLACIDALVYHAELIVTQQQGLLHLLREQCWFEHASTLSKLSPLCSPKLLDV